MQTAAPHTSSARSPTGPAIPRRPRRTHGVARLMQFLPITSIETDNRLLQDTIRAATVDVDEVRRELLIELLHGAHLADSEANIALFERVRDDIVTGKVTNFARLGQRIRSLMLMSDRVRYAVNAFEEEERARSAALLAPKNRSPS